VLSDHERQREREREREGEEKGMAELIGAPLSL